MAKPSKPYARFVCVDGRHVFQSKKAVATHFGVAEKTVQAWLAGRITPSDRHGILQFQRLREVNGYSVAVVELVFDDGKYEEFPSYAAAARHIGVTRQELGNFRRVREKGVLAVVEGGGQ